MSLLNRGFEGGEDSGFPENTHFFFGRVHTQIEHLTLDIIRLQDKLESLSECSAKMRDVDEIYDQIESMRQAISELSAEMAKVKTKMAVVGAKSGMLISAIVVIMLELVKRFIIGL